MEIHKIKDNVEIFFVSTKKELKELDKTNITDAFVELYLFFEDSSMNDEPSDIIILMK